MKLSVQLRLLPTPEQAAILLDTIERFNAAATFAAKLGFENKAYGRTAIHHLAYRPLRAAYGLGAVLTCKAIARAVDSFRINKLAAPLFRKRAAITYHGEDYRFRTDGMLSISSVAGRLIMPVLRGRETPTRGEADLVYRNGKFFLICTYDAQEQPSIEPAGVLGVDLGVVNLATDSTGEVFSGDGVETKRRHFVRRRAGLQRVGTKSAKRRLAKMRRKEGNYRRTENHRISKRIVAKAKGTASAIALEDLKGIRQRTTVRRKERNRLGGWSFYQLRTFIEYKAKLAGVPVILVDPRNTSRTCAVCGHCEKENRKSQAEFECRSCGHADNADLNAALNVRAKGVTQLPKVGRDEAKAPSGELRSSVLTSQL